jgi:hypothetical protein
LARTTIAKGVPADEALDAALDVAIARKRHFLVGGNRIDVRRGRRERHPHAGLTGPGAQRLEQTDRPALVSLGDDVIKRLNPLAGLDRLLGGRIGRGNVLH